MGLYLKRKKKEKERHVSIDLEHDNSNQPNHIGYLFRVIYLINWFIYGSFVDLLVEVMNFKPWNEQTMCVANIYRWSYEFEGSMTSKIYKYQSGSLNSCKYN